jgi:hypothetical protein
MNILDPEDTEIQKLEEELQRALNHIDEVQNRINDIFKDENITPGQASE